MLDIHRKILGNHLLYEQGKMEPDMRFLEQLQLHEKILAILELDQRNLVGLELDHIILVMWVLSMMILEWSE